ncbi:hypothetical protein KEJ17_00155 [Candidatus Bathyarchaeota archaeon]|nr:hypothetical protein [Candidatus Bathyarchaeota archaeon]
MRRFTLSPQYAALLAMFIPFAAALLSHLITKFPRGGANIAKVVCILTAYLSFLLIFTLIPIAYNGPFGAHLFSISLPIGVIDMGFYIDCLSLIPAFISSLFTALALTYNIYYLSPYNRRYEIKWEFNRSYSFILLFNGAVLGVLFSDNLLSLLIFWELVSLCSYALISFWNEDDFSLRAAIKALVMTHIGGLALLITTIVIYSVTGTMKIPVLGQKIPTESPLTHVILSLLLIAALPKTVLFPFHTWLPDATIAPTSTILVFHEGGTLTGIYMIIRFFTNVLRVHASSATTVPLHPLFGDLGVWGFIISFIGSFTLLIGVLNGLIESNFKRIVAYGTISGLGYIAIAVGLDTPLSVAATLFLMMSHAFTFGLLFLCAGAVVYATGKHDINDMERLYERMPITALCCLTGVLSMSTMPLLSDFAGKYLVFSAIIDAKAAFFIVIAFLGCILNAAAAIRLFYTAFMRRTARTPAGLIIKDPAVPMIFPMVLMSMVILTFGVVPSVPLNLLIIPAVKQILPEQSINIISQQGFIETPLGFWNPTVTSIFVIAFLTLFILMTFYSKKTGPSYRSPASEEAVKPFICGEDSNVLDGPQAYHLYRVLSDTLRIDSLRHALNIDRAYNLLAARFFNFAEKMRHLDIQQSYFPAVLSFTLGALIITMLAILGG